MPPVLTPTTLNLHTGTLPSCFGRVCFPSDFAHLHSGWRLLLRETARGRPKPSVINTLAHVRDVFDGLHHHVQRRTACCMRMHCLGPSVLSLLLEPVLCVHMQPHPEARAVESGRIELMA